MAEKFYGARECPRCGKAFQARYPAQVFCGAVCEKLHREKLAERRRARAEAGHCSDLDWVNGQLEDALASKRAKPRAGHKKEAGPKAAKQEGKNMGKEKKAASASGHVASAPKPRKAMGQSPAKAPRANKPRQRGSAMRKCHDCGKPTPDYRCRACLAKWRQAQGVARDATDDYEGE